MLRELELNANDAKVIRGRRLGEKYFHWDVLKWGCRIEENSDYLLPKLQFPQKQGSIALKCALPVACCQLANWLIDRPRLVSSQEFIQIPLSL